ncbi:MAG: hypothetical protein LBI45_05315 [Bacteroidales bacterium]|jgi:hypothetical protein|nr:hypothetical protein [Bacteroidales bacterium]
MNNPRTTQQNRTLYWLFSQLGVNNKFAISEIVFEFTGGRTEHTSELEFMEAMELIKYLKSIRTEKRHTVSERIDTVGDDAPERAELDKKRKGVLRAIFRWGELQGLKYTMDYVKGIACKAAGTNYFNEISPAGLTRIYHEFCKKQKTVSTKNETYEPFCMN